MKRFSKKNKYIIISLLFIGFVGLIFVLVPGINVKGYAVNYGGRITETMPITVCQNPYSCSGSCVLCGCGPWYQVVFQPSGGSGFYICPTFQASKGNNPTYSPGGYVLTGGTAVNALDPNNTAAIVKSNNIKESLMLAWFRILDLLS